MNNSVSKSRIKIKPFRILIAAYVNLNAVDGSAFFVAGLARMLASSPSNEITILSPNPIERSVVVSELAELSNVTIVEPLDESLAELHSNSQGSFDRSQFSQAIALLDSKSCFDAVLVRDNLVAVKAIEYNAELASKLAAYVTGVRWLDEEVPVETLTLLRRLAEAETQLLCQTPEMASLVEDSLKNSRPRIALLEPHVPISGHPPLHIPSAKGATHLSYVGKFFPDWIPDQIFSAFKAVQQRNGNLLRLSVAGDYFKASEASPNFVENVKYLLNSAPNLAWFGALPRNEARSLILTSQVGLSWRSPNLNRSSEFSTKVLEYGSLGRPVILNRTAMHERIFGADYPLFVNSSIEFRKLLSSLPVMKDELEYSASVAAAVASHHSYQSIFDRLMSVLQPGISSERAIPTFSSDQKAQAVIFGNQILLEPSKESNLSEQRAFELAHTFKQEWSDSVCRLEVNDTMIEEMSSKTLHRADDSLTESLRRENEMLQRRLDKSEKALANLRGSKLGRLQRKLWSVRKRLR